MVKQKLVEDRREFARLGTELMETLGEYLNDLPDAFDVTAPCLVFEGDDPPWGPSFPTNACDLWYPRPSASRTDMRRLRGLYSR